LAQAFLSVDPFLLLALLSLGVVVGSLSVSAYGDFKKVSAAISILHMCFGLFLLFSVAISDFELLFSWHHHSVIASLNF
jgi:hypothetical protein